MKKLAIAALSAASVALVATADTPANAPATPRDATALGTIVLEENFEDYAKVTTNANGTVVVQAARNDGTVVDATVYTKDKVDTLVQGSGSVTTADGKATVTVNGDSATVYTADKADSTFKAKQTAVTDPTAAGTSTTFIATAAQNANGEITVTKATVPTATTSVAGITSLSSAVDSTSEAVAATPKAVKQAYDLANGKQDPETTLSGYGITDAYTKTQTDANIATATNAVVEAVADGYKPKQTAKTDPTASGNSTTFIATVSQDANGVITATKKTVSSASTTAAGIVQLNNTTTSTSTTQAATANAVKAAKDAADAKVPLSNVKVTPAAGGASSAITSSTVVELGNAFIVCTTTGEGASAKNKAVLYAR